MKFLLTSILLILCASPLYAQVGIGEPLPDGSTTLEVTSTTKGALFPRMTGTQRDLISNPAKGLLIFNSTTNDFEFNTGTALVPVWLVIDNKKHQSGTYNVGATSSGWQYYNVTFATPFASIPAIVMKYREGTGVDQTTSHTAAHIKVANASTTGFTIGIRETSSNIDVFIDWKAVLKTQ